MEVRAVGKFMRVQPRKVRIIADQVRGRNAVHAAALLQYHTSKGAHLLRKVLVSAMANAQENHGISPETLSISTIMVDEGPRLKRMQARAMGRGNRIIKKTSHITVVVEEVEAVKAVKPHGTKAKPRPTFATAGKGKSKAKKAAEETKVDAAPVAEETPVEEVTTSTEEVISESTPEAEATTEAAPAEEANAEAEASDEKGAE
ncbi:MAG: 50S ribosomal protein L22 [Armatimonadetes bacterium 55-13]|nr:50S ribosomal protein L22 [Armatimonadota bacterium]OJU65017.1 MAG: 50S ribosomal protein L22 [Armatimonadetes bacterium 55-13]